MAKRTQPNSVTQLPYLDTFVEAAEQASFTGAAKSLGLTQAAVSQRIGTLEKMLGKSLFRRSGTRVRMTEAGESLYRFAQQIMQLHAEAYESITGRQTPASGELLIAASSIPGEHLLPGLLSEFGKKYPKIRVKATIRDSLAAIQEVEKGNAHLGLVGRKIESAHLEFRTFANDEVLIVVSRDHPWNRRRTVSFNQLARQPLILRESGSGSRWCFENALAESGKRLNQVNVSLELGANEAIKQAVVQGMGVAVLSAAAVAKELDSGELHAVRISGLPLTRAMYVVVDTRRALPLTARMFLQMIDSMSLADK